MTADTTAPSKPRKPRKAPKAQPIHHAEPPGPLPDGERRTIALADIIVDKGQDRSDRGAVTEAAINAMSESLKTWGQLQPIGINLVDGEHRLIWGHLRHAAAEVITLSPLDAKVYQDLTEEQVRQLRLTENTQRLGLNPVEETIAIAALLDLSAQRLCFVHGRKMTFFEVGAADKKRIIADVAVRQGMSEAWVTDRAYLARLGPKVRQLVLDELLPLSHAREIARVIDPKVQESIARNVAADGKGDMPADLEDVRTLCAQNLFTLATVAWELAVPFAGKPPCVDCRFNSANQPGLFAGVVSASKTVHESRTNQAGSCNSETEAGICTNAGCYLEKTRVASSKLSAASGKAMKLIADAPKKDREKVARSVAGEVVPDGIQTKALAKRIRDRAERARNRVGGSAPAAKFKPEPTASALRAQAERDLTEALRERAEKFEPLIANALKKRPGAWTLLTALHENKLFQACQSTGDRGIKAARSPGLLALINQLAEPSWEGLLAIEKDCGRRYDLIDPWNYASSGVIEIIATAIGVHLGEAPPTIDDFLPKPKKGEDGDGAEPKAAKGKKRKPAAADDNQDGRS